MTDQAETGPAQAGPIAVYGVTKLGAVAESVGGAETAVAPA